VQEIVLLAQSLGLSGKRLTEEFYEANGIAREFIEDAPVVAPPKGNEKEDPTLEMALPQRSFFSAVKKKY